MELLRHLFLFLGFRSRCCGAKTEYCYMVNWRHDGLYCTECGGKV